MTDYSINSVINQFAFSALTAYPGSPGQRVGNRAYVCVFHNQLTDYDPLIVAPVPESRRSGQE